MRKIGEWLESLGLNHYTSTFESNDIDLDALAMLGEEDLRDLGVSLGHRKKILRAISETNALPRTPAAVAASNPGRAKPDHRPASVRTRWISAA